MTVSTIELLIGMLNNFELLESDHGLYCLSSFNMDLSYALFVLRFNIPVSNFGHVERVS